MISVSGSFYCRCILYTVPDVFRTLQFALLLQDDDDNVSVSVEEETEESGASVSQVTTLFFFFHVFMCAEWLKIHS